MSLGVLWERYREQRRCIRERLSVQNFAPRGGRFSLSITSGIGEEIKYPRD